MLATGNTDHAQRFAKKSTEATLNYAHAGYFAGIFAFNALFEAWTDACVDAARPSKSISKSWFRNPAKADLFNPWTFWTPPANTAVDMWSGQNWMTQAWWTPFASPVANASPVVNAWANFFPTAFTSTDLSFTRSPFWNTAAAALPMTWSLMSFGMPHAIARPTAEANTAALEAFDSAQQFANDHMTAYTTALEQTPKDASSDQAPNLLDAYTLMFWPWLSETPKTDSQDPA